MADHNMRAGRRFIRVAAGIYLYCVVVFPTQDYYRTLFLASDHDDLKLNPVAMKGGQSLPEVFQAFDPSLSPTDFPPKHELATEIFLFRTL
jgi:hypothetical protein